MSQSTFKIYVDKDGTGKNTEVRRFAAPGCIGTFSFADVLDQLKTYFPCLREKSFRVFWKDSENDQVIISSDDELKIALNENTNQVTKLYVNIIPSHDDGESAERERLEDMTRPCFFAMGHPTVICDGCNKQVVGFRYKCLQCPDFDLCQTCEAKQLHDRHFMLRMPFTVDIKSQMNTRGVGEGLFIAGKKKGKRATLDEDTWCPYVKKHGKKHGKRHGHNAMMDTLASVANALNLQENFVHMEQPKPQRDVATSGCCNSTGQQEERVKQVAEESTSQTSSANQPDKDDNKMYQFHDFIGDFLNAVTPVVSDVMKQNVSILQNIIAKECTPMDDTHNNNKSPNFADISNSDNNKFDENQKDSDVAGYHNDNPVDNKSVSSSGEAGGTDLKNLGQALKEHTEKASGGEDLPREASIGSDKYSDASGDDGIRVKPVETELEDGGWTLLAGRGNAKANINGSGSGVQETGAIPKSVEQNKGSVKIKPTPNKEDLNSKCEPSLFPNQGQAHVADSLRRMLAMGFSNEGNRLGDLLMKHNGDISAVVDQLLQLVQ